MIVDWLSFLTLYAYGGIAMHFTLHVHESRFCRMQSLSFHSGAGLMSLSNDVLVHHVHGLRFAFLTR